MKWTAFTLDLSRIRKFVQNMGVLGKTFLILSTSTFLLFVLLGLAGYGNARWKSSPASSMKGIAASLSSDFFMDIIGLEVPHVQEDRIQSTFSQTNILRFVFRVMTDINPRDPKTMLAHEVPGLAGEAPYLLRKTSGTDPDGGPQDYPPPVQKDPNSSGAGERPVLSQAHRPLRSPARPLRRLLPRNRRTARRWS
ncbi:hypothetical protein N6H14_22710 [Paenibacillus sp. CC-CFT747]|nr:hypothetical protein N6H14_22710 [Paenibacillus sp. CC-CFT747]